MNNDLPSGTITELLVDPNDSNTVYVGVRRRGAFKTTDGGATWLPTGGD